VDGSGQLERGGRLVKRIDTHTHPKISKHFAFAPGAVNGWWPWPGASASTASASRALSRHPRTGHPSVTSKGRIRASAECSGPGDMALVPGAEVNIRGGCARHRAGRGGGAAAARRAFPQRLSEHYEPTLREFLDVDRRLRHRAHRRPHVPPRQGARQVPASDLRRLHALEVNGKDFGTEVMLLTQARALGPADRGRQRRAPLAADGRSPHAVAHR